MKELAEKARKGEVVVTEVRHEERKVTCGECSAFISPFADTCPNCGVKFEEKIVEERGALKKIPVKIISKSVDGEEYKIPQVKKVKGVQKITIPEELEKAVPKVEEIPVEVGVESKEERYVIPTRKKGIVEEEKIEVPEIKEEIPVPKEKPKEGEIKLKEWTPHEKELIQAAEKEGKEVGLKEAKEWVVEEEKVGEKGETKAADISEWGKARRYEVREAKEAELKIPAEVGPVPSPVLEEHEEEKTEFELLPPQPSPAPPAPIKKKIFTFLKKKKESAAEFEVVKEKEEPVSSVLASTVDFAPLSEEFEEIEVYPLIEPFAYARILYNRMEHTRFYEVVEPELTEKEKEMLETIETAFTKSLSIGIEELDREPELHLQDAMRTIIKSYSLPVPREEEDKLFYFVKRDLLGYGRINTLMKDPNIEDISCDGPGTHIYIYHRRYESMETNIVFPTEGELESYVIRLAQRCGKHISTAVPLIDSTLMDGSRVVMTLGKEISTKGSTFTIRKFREDPFTPTDLATFKTISPLMLAYIWLAVQYGMSVLFVGGTASGKTTTLNAVSLFIPPQMKIVSIEETRELNLPHPNWIPGCTRAGFGGELVGGRIAGEVDMYDLLKAALRERPEYIIVGEIRGSEAYVLFQAMATGHTTYSTMHADSVPGLIHRLENKPIDIPRVMIPSLDAVCIQVQTRVGGRRVRRLKQIVEIIGLDPHSKELLTNEVFRWVPALDDFEFSGKSYVLEKIMMKANLRREEVMNELKRRQAVIEWMTAKGIRKYGDVARIINEYQIHPQEILERIKSEMSERGV